MTDSSKPTTDKDGVNVFVEKAPDYRAIHADGHIVSPNSHRNVVISFYNERLAIPKQLRITTEGDQSFTEHYVDGKNGMFRQVDASVFLDVTEIDELISELERARDFILKHQPLRESKND